MSNDIGELSQRQRATQKLMFEAEKEANEKITKSYQRIKEAEREEQQKLEQVKDQYEKLTERERINQEIAHENAKQKSYAAVRESQRLLQNELNRVKREGQNDLERADEYYRTTIYDQGLEGERKLQELQQKQFVTEQEQIKRTDQTAAFLKEDHAQRVEELRANQDATLGALKAEAATRYETTKENTELATAQAEAQFRQQHEHAIAGHRQAIDRQDGTAFAELNRRREDHSRKLAAYDQRQSDPFYQLVNLGGQLSETEEAFFLTASIPEHERQNLAVSVRGNQLVVSGQRRAEEKLELTPGHVQSTASYQTFSESFPLHYPVDPRGIQREFDGDQLIVKIPKKKTYDAPSYKRTKNIAPSRASRPHFPENLPVASQEAAKPASEGERPQATRKSGKTLG